LIFKSFSGVGVKRAVNAVVEACLAHLKQGVKGIYDKGAHLEERKEMMQWWSDEFESLLK